MDSGRKKGMFYNFILFMDSGRKKRYMFCPRTITDIILYILWIQAEKRVFLSLQHIINTLCNLTFYLT